MSFRKFLAAALAVSAVHAASDPCKDDVEIQSNGDVSSYTSCQTIDGKVTVGKDVTEFSLSGVTEITGDLSIEGATGLTAISLPSLRTIGGAFSLSVLTTLTSLSAPELTKVGSISFEHLPILSELSFAKEITEADSVLITDTDLRSLDGINLAVVKEFNINNNKKLKTVEVQLGNVSNIIDFSYNGKGFNLSLPELVWANNFTLRDAGSASFPKLEKINSTISFVNNTFEELHLDSLKEVGNSFALISNTKLENATATDLENVGGTFQIANNTKLENILGSFDSLTEVDGSIDLSGTFTNVSFASLDDVRGSFNLQSTGDLDCDDISDAKSKAQGKSTCKSGLKVAKSSEDGSLSTEGDGSGSDGDDDDSSDARRVGTSAALALFAAGVAVLSL